MLPPRARFRLAVNVALDAALAAASVALAGWIVAPDRALAHPVTMLGWGAVALLLAGLPFRLWRQHWRFVGAWEMVGIAAAGALASGAFAAGLYAARIPLPGPAFPVAHALALFALLALPRVVYRLLRETPAAVAPAADAPPAAPVLLLGAGEGANRLLAALATEPAPAYRAVGLLSARDQETGRRIQGCPVLGSFEDAPAVLDRLRAAGEAPLSLVVTDPALDGAALDGVLSLARREALSVAWAPAPTALDPRPRTGA